MFSKLLRLVAPFTLLLAAPAFAQDARPISADDLRRHIEILASDRFEGRGPGTQGETLTINYIAEQLRARGLEPGGENGSWFQPVPLVERTPRASRVTWTARGRTLEFAQDAVALRGRAASERVVNAPVIFAGHGIRMPERGIDQLAGVDVTGAVVIMLFDAPQIEGLPSHSARSRAVAAAGAAAVITVIAEDGAWNYVSRAARQAGIQLASEPGAPITGAMRLSTAQRLIGDAGGDLDRLVNAQPGSSFRAVTLPMRATIEVDSDVRPFASNNVIGRIRGSGSTGESLLYLGHWDHEGICRAEGEDRLCNGAVDNASGIAALIEIAGRLGAGRRPARDILILATTAEELGLLGAEHFAARPTVPLASIVGALNLDTIAIHPAGTPVAVLGRGNAALDAVVDATIAAVGRRLDTDGEADAFVRRQDGYALSRAGVPAIMVGGSFSNMDQLNAFLRSNYHGPEDELTDVTPLDGAAEDANLHVALGRRLADPTVYRRTPAAGN